MTAEFVDIEITMPRSLHRQAARAAARDGVSLQDWTLAVLAYDLAARDLLGNLRIVPRWWVEDDSTPC
jgi:hypothetical protein